MSDRVKWTGWPTLVDSARTAIAALASVLAARLFRLPEAYWAPITTLVIVGTMFGALLGAIVASLFGSHLIVFGICVFILGLLSAVVRSDRSAFRFGSVTLAIVLLVPRTGSPWQIAFNRLAEVSIGIGVALILAWVWPERELPTPQNASQKVR
jgi:uncharacterized membrane protein YgaE (UPF0421/DUF939 family)